MNDLHAELSRHLKGEVRFDKVTRQLYSTDASMYQMEPVGVIVPRDEEDLGTAVELARKHLVPVLPRGGGTSLAGQCVGHALMMDLSTHMNKVLELNVEEGWVKVQPGLVQDQLNAYLAPHGYLFGPDTSTSNRATIGGMTGNNSSGSHSIIYGKTVDHVIEVDTILSDGSWTTFAPLTAEGLETKMKGEGLEGHIYREVLRIAEANREEVEKRYPKIMRRVSGYNLDEMVKSATPNLASLLVGSEGTLALSRAIKCKISPLPKVKGLLVAHFEDMIRAVETDETVLSHGPSAAELMDRRIIRQATASPVFQGRTGFLQGDPGAIVIVEFYGESRQEVDDKLDKLEQHLKRNKMGYAHVRAMEPGQQQQVWELRKAGLGLLMGTRSEAKPVAFVEDTAVDPIKLPAFLKAFEEVVNRHGTSAGYYGHCSVGCLHIRPFIDMKLPEEREKMMSIFREVAGLVKEHGGAMSAEHGDGLARSWLIKEMFGEQLYAAFQDVKAAFDPTGLMNPGKIVEAQQPLENLRLGDFYQNNQLPIELDFSKDGGFNFAVEMCNGNGQCRKLDVGTMCPSYQATRNDRHSTRGRANALRGFISGTLPMSEFTSPEMYEVMDLCLECKACKTECPSNVDMAAMKYEFLYHYNKAHGVPLRTRVFANAALLNRIGSATTPFSNWGLRFPFSRIMNSLLGIAPKRRLPPFARQRFSTWFKGHAPAANGAGERPRVVLFHDTFMEYNQPELGRDTVRILEAAGYEVLLGKRRCCGRPIISKGLLDQGRQYARANIDALKPYAAQGIPIIGVEPSCLLTLKEDYLQLLPGEDAELVAGHCITIDEFLAGLVKEGKLPLREDAAAREILLHGHCHQKALVGTGPTLEVLRSLPGASVREIDSGCCGMAGSFGYEKEHYDISMTVGEQRLFPAVR
ncbi:MAG: FAD-binding protein, partial [SAR324 cluster bacterium]|nr:FAD-binding protein [SAR324 cluster bacterium]